MIKITSKEFHFEIQGYSVTLMMKFLEDKEASISYKGMINKDKGIMHFKGELTKDFVKHTEESMMLFFIMDDVIKKYESK